MKAQGSAGAHPEPPGGASAVFHTRSSLLFTTVLGAASAPLALLSDFPFHPRLFWVAVASSLMHFIFWALFHLISVKVWRFLNFMDIFLMGFVIHYTGGLLSPFIALFPIIFITGAGYWMNYPLAITASLASFITVIALEYWGLLPFWPISPEKMYASPWMTLITMLSVCGHMAIAGMVYKITVDHLHRQVAADAEKERSLLSQMIRLDAKAQAGHLAAGFAHDIRGPISTVFGFTDSVRGQPGLPRDLVELSESIDREMHRVAFMVDRMIQSAKPGVKERKRVCARALMEELVKVGSLLPDAKGVKFREVFPENGDLGVLADLNELKQAYFNLIKNAVESLRRADSPRIVTVEVSMAGPRVSIEVADNGPGIPAELLPRLLTDTVSGKEDGTGLGLLLVKDILEAYGGTISIHSELGLGTRIFTSLPLEVS